MGRIARAALVLSLCLAVTAGLAVYSEAVEPPDAPSVARHAKSAVERPQCGGYRWKVKTLTDPGAAGVDPIAQDTTVAALGALPPRRADDVRVPPIETQVWRLRDVRLLGIQQKPDGDVHLVVADQAGRTMITEFPSPECDGAAPAAFRTRIDAARSALSSRYGDPGPAFQRLHGSATLTGVGFFDYSHNQTGAAPNAIELHPVLSIVPTAQEAVRSPGLR